MIFPLTLMSALNVFPSFLSNPLYCILTGLKLFRFDLTCPAGARGPPPASLARGPTLWILCKFPHTEDTGLKFANLRPFSAINSPFFLFVKNESTFIPDCQSIWVRACQTIWVRACQSIWVRACQSIWVRACQSIWVSACQSIWVRVCLPAPLMPAACDLCLPYCPAVCLAPFMSTCLNLSVAPQALPSCLPVKIVYCLPVCC